MIPVLLGLLAGVATPTQTSVNGKLREKNGSAYLTTLVSFSCAVIVLVLIALFTEGGLSIPFSRIAEEPLWIWSGGLCGTIIILMNTICLPKLGSANTVVIVSTGQIITSLIIDQFGLFDSSVARMDLMRTIGAALVIAGVFLVSREAETKTMVSSSVAGPENSHNTSEAGKLLYVIGALAGGAACGIQVAVNGTLSTVIDNSVQTTLLSMTIGLISAAVLTAVLVLVKGKKIIFDDGYTSASKAGRKWWMYFGGSFGVVIVLSNAVIAPSLGTGLVTVLNLVGMMATSLLIDAAGFLGIPKKPVTPAKMCGMLLMIAGTVLITLF